MTKSVCHNGAGTYFASEGVFNFGAKGWGPQKVRMVISATSDGNVSLAVAGDAGVKTMADLKGKRVAVVRSSPALTIGAQAHLAFAGLTFDDVEVVEFGGYGASWKAMVNGQVDAAIASTTSGPTRNSKPLLVVLCGQICLMMTKKAGLVFRKLHHTTSPHTATLGTGISKEKPSEAGVTLTQC